MFPPNNHYRQLPTHALYIYIPPPPTTGQVPSETNRALREEDECKDDDEDVARVTAKVSVAALPPRPYANVLLSKPAANIIQTAPLSERSPNVTSAQNAHVGGLALGTKAPLPLNAVIVGKATKPFVKPVLVSAAGTQSTADDGETIPARYFKACWFCRRTDPNDLFKMLS